MVAEYNTSLYAKPAPKVDLPRTRVYLSGDTQKEIAEREGISQQAIDQVLQEMGDLPKIAKPSAEHLIDFDPDRAQFGSFIISSHEFCTLLS